jgi:hypothetical protein
MGCGTDLLPNPGPRLGCQQYRSFCFLSWAGKYSDSRSNESRHGTRHPPDLDAHWGCPQLGIQSKLGLWSLRDRRHDTHHCNHPPRNGADITKDIQMRGFLAAFHQIGPGVVYIQPLSPTDPGYGQGHPDHRPDNSLPEWGGPVDPGYGQGGFQPIDPGYGQGHPRPPHVSPPINIPPPEGVVSPPIVIPRPTLPPGSGVVVPLPADANVPAPTGATPPGSKPYVLWYGPGTESTVVYLQPAEVAAPK